jgi:AP2-like factor (ANT lineage)
MASANNWLGFSLSGQGNPQLHQNGSPAAASIDVSGGGDFYGLQAQTPPEAHLGMSGLRADTNYGVMDGFDGGNQETQGELMCLYYSTRVYIPFYTLV